MNYQESFMSDTKEGKYRPCIIKDVGDGTVVIMAMVTTKSHPNQYTIRDWKEAGLSCPSYINYGVTQTITSSILTPDNYIGHLSNFDIQRIKSQQRDK